ncbi:hypothetical protein V8F20_000201 [Naviculisporaceae sp. PSN 640]
MSSPNSRKRPAPGANPIIPTNQMQRQFSPTTADNAFAWNQMMDSNNGFVNAGASNATPFPMMPSQGQYGQGAPPTPSTALTRRQNNRALVPSGNRPGGPFDTTSEPWNSFGDDSAFLQGANGSVDEHDNLEILEERALRAKREAQAKRKQIPPFVQKLSSFLDESRNTDLIRWSDKGDSFIVLDEDEFAKTLIPELFKHNNYASFVRQLNMYGFHKRVGLSDNSMKASERKNKSPSEYYNPYFRRGHPNLLWLINKPKGGGNKTKSKVKKEDVDVESEEDAGVDEAYQTPAFPSAAGNRATPAANEVGPLQKKDLVQVKNQLERLQQQQIAISTMLNKLRQEHSQLFQQALMFQNMHTRHENSINAILNFLANVFRKSLEEQGGTHNVQDLLASIIPGSQQGQAMPQVVDLSDFMSPQSQSVTTMGTPKRQQRLLPPIPQNQFGKSTTVSPSPSPSPAAHNYRQPSAGSVTEVFDTSPSDTTSSVYMKAELQNNPQEGMMKIIQDSNAVNSPNIDLPNVAATTPVSMNNDQRNKMLSIMAGQQASKAPAPGPLPVPAPAPAPAFSAPPMPAPTPAIPTTTAAPIVPLVAGGLSLPGSGVTVPSVIPPAISPPPLDNFIPPAEFDALQRMTEAQNEALNQISNFLGPLSPSGRIPGLDEQGNPNTSYFDNADFDQFINTNALSDPSGGLDGGNFDGLLDNTGGNDFFSLDGAGDMLGGGGGNSGVSGSTPVTTAGNGNQSTLAPAPGFEAGRVYDPGSPNNTPSPAHTEEITRNDLDFGALSPERDPKRRRRQ